MSPSTKKLANCPLCESDNIATSWATGRRFVQECHDCPWRGKTFEPPKIPIETTMFFVRPGIGGWTYHLFDSKGYPITYSQGYAKRKDCVANAKAELAKHDRKDPYGRCTAVIWPAAMKVKGTVLRGKR
jgi:hypothetical protein